MKIISDFHIHSRFARACSKDLNVENLDKWAKIKGINVLGTGDFTHPQWFKELKENLKPAEKGLYEYKFQAPNSNFQTRFLLTAEISNIYSKNGKVRRIHTIIFAPSFEAVEKINNKLSAMGFNLKSDGRPILGQDIKETVKIILDLCPACFIVPAHIWTPWFSIFGSMSGFDSIGECFEELTPQIFAIETGLSSDPAMNWRLSALDKIAIISNSDAHSLENLGREANVFDCELSYSGIIEAIKSKDPKQFLYTIEFFPEEGKYHYDGHRDHQIRLSPEETKKYQGLCPKCQRPVTIGVMNRVAKLADRQEGEKPANTIPYKSLVPLRQIIAEALDLGVGAKAVQKEYFNLIEKFGSEFNVLLEASPSQIESAISPVISEGIKRVKEGKLYIEPGYDGEFGKVKIFEDEERKDLTRQKQLL